jgi:drug/metabolite transporter (DMT)-like permease
LELGIFQIGVSSILFAYGIKRITALESILTAVLEPLFSPVWVYIIIGEAPGRRAILGGLVIIGAVVSSSLVSIRRNVRLVR